MVPYICMLLLLWSTESGESSDRGPVVPVWVDIKMIKLNSPVVIRNVQYYHELKRVALIVIQCISL